MNRWITLVMAVLVLASTAAADIVKMKDGHQLEGEVIAEEAGSILLKMPRATARLRRAEIASIERGASFARQADERLAALGTDRLAAYFELADWCKKQRLCA